MTYGSIEPPRRQAPSTNTVVLAGCGGLIAAFGLVCIAIFAWLVVQPEGGVKLNNELSSAERERLAEFGVAVDDSLAYFDRSTWLDGSDVLILTPTSVVQVKDGRRTEALLHQVEDMRRTTDPLTGDVIELDLEGGRSFKVNVPLWNGGEIFTTQLERALKAASL
jgi:hypothetical protein